MRLAGRKVGAVGIGAVDLPVAVVVREVGALLDDLARAVWVRAVGESVAVVVPAVVAESFRTAAGHGTTIEDRPVAVSDFLATVCGAVGIEVAKQNASNVGRPIRIVDADAKPIEEVLA